MSAAGASAGASTNGGQGGTMDPVSTAGTQDTGGSGGGSVAPDAGVEDPDGTEPDASLQPDAAVEADAAVPLGPDGGGGAAGSSGGNTGGAAAADAGAGTPVLLEEVRYTVASDVTMQVDTARGLLRSLPVNGGLQIAFAGDPEVAVPPSGDAVVNTPLGGVLTLSADGSFSYQPPAATSSGLDAVPFVISDETAAKAESQVVFGLTRSVLGGQPGIEMVGGGSVFVPGSAASSVGDFNGDGFEDVVVFARGNLGDGERDLGYLVLGQREPNNVDLSAADAEVRILGESTGLDDFSVAVSPAGRVNDDELDDFIIGIHNEPVAPGAAGLLGGKAYVLFGTSTPPAEIDLATLEADQRGFMIVGAAGQDHLGFSVSGAGNVNGLGGDDVVLGAIGRFPEAGESPTDGKAYVVFGKNDFAPVDLAALGTSGFRMNGEPGSFGEAGVAVTDVGDWNGDGLADVAVSATKIEFSAGRIYVVYGKADSVDVELASVAAGNGGFAIDGDGENTQAGRTLQNGGDLGGSTLPDLLIGVPNPPGESTVGGTVVLFGKADTNAVELSNVAGSSLGFVVAAEEASDRGGFALSGPGDWNGDGLSDLVIGAHENGTDRAGAVHVLFGSAALSNGVDLATPSPGAALTLRGIAQSHLGFTVSSVGDHNGDGFPDLLVAAPQQSDTGGSVYLLFGRP